MRVYYYSGRKSAMAEREEKGTGKRRTRRWITLGVTGGLILLILVAALALAAQLFGGEREFPVEPLQPRDYTLLSRIMGRVLQEIRTGSPKESELVLTPADVNSLLRIAANGATLKAMMGGGGSANRTTPQSLRYENGGFRIIAPVRTGLTWLRGGVIMVDMSVRPEKDGDKLTVDIPRLETGSLTPPGFLTERMRDHSLAKLRNREEYRRFDRCVRSFRIDEKNRLHLVYRPAELRKLLPAETRRLLGIGD